MSGGTTFRYAINFNKRKVIEYLQANGLTCTKDIEKNYKGSRIKYDVNKAINELRKEGRIVSDNKVHFWKGKYWELTGM